jgi:hypothetical protein
MMELLGTSPFDTEVSQVATVKQLTASRYQVTMTESELVLVKNALAEAERVSRFGMEVLDDVDNGPGATGPSENNRLRREIEALAMREASLKSLQKTMAEVDPRGKPAPMQHPELDQLSSGALQVPPFR